MSHHKENSRYCRGNLDILVDANQAQSPYPWQAGVIWDLDGKKNESKNA